MLYYETCQAFPELTELYVCPANCTNPSTRENSLQLIISCSDCDGVQLQALHDNCNTAKLCTSRGACQAGQRLLCK